MACVFVLADLHPEACQRARERGRQTTAIRFLIRQPFGAHVGCLPCRGCGHIGSGLAGPAWGAARRATSSGPEAAARRQCKRSAAADGRPCASWRSHASHGRHCAQPRSPAPESKASLSLASAPATVRTLPQPGTIPVPQSRSADASHVDRDARSVREDWETGITLLSGVSSVCRRTHFVFRVPHLHVA